MSFNLHIYLLSESHQLFFLCASFLIYFDCETSKTSENYIAFQVMNKNYNSRHIRSLVLSRANTRNKGSICTWRFRLDI